MVCLDWQAMPYDVLNNAWGCPVSCLFVSWVMQIHLTQTLHNVSLYTVCKESITQWKIVIDFNFYDY